MDHHNNIEQSHTGLMVHDTWFLKYLSPMHEGASDARRFAVTFNHSRETVTLSCGVCRETFEYDYQALAHCDPNFELILHTHAWCAWVCQSLLKPGKQALLVEDRVCKMQDHGKAVPLCIYIASTSPLSGIESSTDASLSAWKASGTASAST